MSVKLKLGSNYRVLTPAVKVKSSLCKNESSSIRNTSVLSITSSRPSVTFNIDTSSVWHLEHVVGYELTSTTDGVRGTESVNCVRKSIDSISVVERLSTKSLVKNLVSLQRCTVVNVSIRLDNPDKLLTRMVEVQLDLVGR